MTEKWGHLLLVLLMQQCDKTKEPRDVTDAKVVGEYATLKEGHFCGEKEHYKTLTTLGDTGSIWAYADIQSWCLFLHA